MVKWKQWMVGALLCGGTLLGTRTTTVFAAQTPPTTTPTDQSAAQVTQSQPANQTLATTSSAVHTTARRKKARPKHPTKVRQRTVTAKKKVVKATGRKQRATTPAKTPKVSRKVKATPKKATTKMKYVPLVGHGSYTKPHVHFEPTTTYLRTRGLQNEPSTIKQTRSYLDHYEFKTTFYLPQRLSGRDLSVPQSAAFSADNHYLYVMYVDGKQATNHYQDGWAVRYDWNRLMALGANRPGQMAMLRRAAADQARGRLTRLDRKVLACIKIGPRFNSGHAQSLALNPKTNQLWYVKAYDQDTPNMMVELNPTTLLPAATVKYHADGHANLGAALTFDSQGNAYYWTHAKVATKTRPLGAVRIYRGSVSKQGIQYKVIPQGLAADPGFYVQSMGYDEVTGRLYLVSDESITSLPLADLGHLKTSQVGESNFGAHREFEGLFFMHHSNNGFLLTNRGTEIMRMVRV